MRSPSGASSEYGAGGERGTEALGVLSVNEEVDVCGVFVEERDGCCCVEREGEYGAAIEEFWMDEVGCAEFCRDEDCCGGTSDGDGGLVTPYGGSLCE